MFDQNPLLGPGTSSFTSHTFEIVILLLGAFILGFIIAYLLRQMKISALEKETKNKAITINELNAKLDIADKANNNLNSDLLVIKEKNETISQELIALREELAKIEAEMKQLEEDKNSWQKKYEDLLAERDELKASLAQKTSDNNSQLEKTALAVSAQALASNKNNDEKSINAELTKSRDEANALNEKLKKSENTLKTELDGLTEKNKELSGKLDDCGKNHIDKSELTRLREESLRWQNSSVEFKDKNDKMTTELGYLKSQLASSTTALSSLTKDFNSVTEAQKAPKVVKENKPAVKPAAKVTKPVIPKITDLDAKQATTLTSTKIAPKISKDLQKIKGIGPKLNKLLHQNGIMNFNDLANSKVDRLNKILEIGGDSFTIHDPSTWPRQAKLLLDGKLKEFEKYTHEITAGKISSH